jgi:hypothetical protein
VADDDPQPHNQQGAKASIANVLRMLELQETEKEDECRRLKKELQKVKEEAATKEKKALDMLEVARLNGEAANARIATLELLSKTMTEQKEAADTTVEKAMEKSEKSEKVLEDLRAANKNLRTKNSQLSKQVAEPAAASVAGPSNALLGSDPANARIQELEAAVAEAKATDDKQKIIISKLNAEFARRTRVLESQVRENAALLQQVAALEAAVRLQQLATLRQFNAAAEEAADPLPNVDAEGTEEEQ